eukprot:Phypoly_transcript_00956.p2 GENE.Phypoly_transcript_00956~~Phypoly_transcript_00956.p2  ORF type:complete len:226 (+),score=32.96 Phypoly_transcript_00956:848-1525(+)
MAVEGFINLRPGGSGHTKSSTGGKLPKKLANLQPTVKKLAKQGQEKRLHATLSSKTNHNLDGPVYSLSCSADLVAVVGNFTYAGDQMLNNVALWDTHENTWISLDNGTNGVVYAITSDSSSTYIGGLFTKAGGASVNSIAKWVSNSNSWDSIKLNITGTVYHLLLYKEHYLFVAGQFSVYNSSIHNFVIFDLYQKVILNTVGVNGTIRKFFIRSDGDILAGGNFG